MKLDLTDEWLQRRAEQEEGHDIGAGDAGTTEDANGTDGENS